MSTAHPLPAQPSLLIIYVSPRGERSASRKLADAYLAAWRAAHPNGKVVIRDIGASAPPPLTENWIAGSVLPPNEQTPAMREAIGVSDAFVDELIEAGEVVVATPIYNLNVPGALKLWIDQVVRAGRTFAIDSSGYHGLLGGRKARVLLTGGGDLREGTPAAAMNFTTPYLRTLLGFVGIGDVEFVYAYHQAPVYPDRETVLEAAINEARALASR